MKSMLGHILLLGLALSLGGCFAIKSPERVSDSHPYRKTGIYRQDTGRGDKRFPGEDAGPGGGASAVPAGTGGIIPQPRSAATNADRLQPAPLGETGDEPDSGGSMWVGSMGRLPAVGSSEQKTPTDLLDKLKANETVQLDYEQVELREILEEIADTLGITLVIDPTIQGKVTMRTSSVRPLHKKDLWPLLQLLLAEAGVSLEKKGRIYHATGKPVLLPGQVGFLDSGKKISAQTGRTLQFIALRNVSQEVVVPVLSALIEPKGKILSMPDLNVIGVIAPPYVQERILNILPLLDSDPFKYRGIRLFHLQNARAEIVGKELEKIINLIEGEKATYRVLALDRINSLLVVSPPERGFRHVEQWVRILDSSSQGNVEQVFVYSVKNLKAKALAQTLMDTFSRNSEKELTVRRNTERETGRDRSEKTADTRLRKKNDGKARSDREAGGTGAPARRSGDRGGQRGVTADIMLRIVADEDTNSLLVRSTPGDYRQLLQTISQLDTPPLEVMCNIVIAEVLLSEENQFGIDWYLLSKYGDALLGTPFDITNGYTITGGENRNPFETHWETTGSFTNQGLVLEGVGGGSVAGVLNALASVGNLKVLSRPSILVRNNQEALIKVGTEEPILTKVSNSDIIVDGQTAITNDVQYRDTGIILTVKPHITKDGIINMEVKQEISKLGDNRTVYDLPSFDSSKIETSVVVRNGTAIILGGIIRSQVRLEKNALPLLGDLPLLGQLFGTTKNQEYRYELVLIIVPEIVDPQKNNDGLVKNFFFQMRKAYQLLQEEIGTGNFLNNE